ncbi:MAG TPA: hypothetical protein VIH35_00735 [Kiritimatiellia bacterium]
MIGTFTAIAETELNASKTARWRIVLVLVVVLVLDFYPLGSTYSSTAK